MRTHLYLTLLVLMLGGLPALAQEPRLPPGDNRPLLRLEGGGPAGNVTALVFSPDGSRLFAAGFDKVVRVWALDAKSGKFELDPASSYRVPIGPGTRGAINALALPPDGTWLAVGGLGVIRGGMEVHNDFGKLWPALGGMTAAMRQDEGLIYVFHTGKREVRLLRGHGGAVESLAFVSPRQGAPLLLVSAAGGWDTAANKKTGEVRLWDVAKEETVAARSDLPFPTPTSPPGIVGFSTGNKPSEVRVLLAWGDQSLRLWDVTRADKKMSKVADGQFNTTIALYPDAQKILTGSFRVRSGGLQVWDVAGAAPTEDKRFVSFDEAPADVFFLPNPVALLHAKEGERAVFVLRRHRKEDKTVADFLQLIDLRPESFGTKGKAVSLWENSSIRPVLAASPDGRYVAVAGSSDHSIRLWPVADLLQGRDQAQFLSSAGTTLRSVSFVRLADKKGSRPGLLLGEKADQAGDLVFDFQKGALSANVKAWTADRPAPGKWAVKASEIEDRFALTVVEDGQPRARLDRWKNQRIEAVALVPPGLAPQVPLVAVAAYNWKTGEPLLDIYHALSGDHLRRFTGHIGRIRGLALSGDGRLLASVADDQTVCVWSLTDLGAILGKFGQLAGVAVREGDKGKVLVAQVEAGTPSAGKLSVDDVVEGVVSKAKLTPLKSPDDFYDAAMMVKPGKTILLRVRTEGGKSRDVEVAVGQGVDVRMPLLTLFVTRSEAGKGRDWLGWNPTGPYDSSRAEAEKYLGWHLNTGKKESPTTFALIGEYRKKYHTPGILDRLVTKGNLREALAEAPRPVPIPRLAVLVGDAVAEATKDGHVVIRQPQGVRVELAIQDYTPKPGDMVEWQFDDGKPQAFSPPEEGRWLTPPLPLPAQGGLHTVRAMVRFPVEQGPAQESRGVLTLRYQPPAPAIASAAPADRLVVNVEKFAFEATVRPGLPDPPVTVTLVHQFANQTKKQTYVVGQGMPLKVTGELILGEGVNLITLSAQNKDPLPNYAENERTVRTLEILYEKKPVPRPIITLTALQPLSKAAASAPKNIAPGQSVIVDVPRVRLSGRIKAEADLVDAQRSAGADKPTAKLTGFKLGSKEHVIDETLDLKPGLQTFRIVAKAAGSKEQAEETVSLLYRPQLPRLQLTSPEPGTVLHETKDGEAGQVRVEGKLFPPEDSSPEPLPLKASVFVNGRQVIVPTALKPGAADVVFPKVPLVPGANLVRVELSQEWGGEPSADAVDVRYLRPPRILALTKEKVGAKPFVDLVAQVYSPLPLSDPVRVEVRDADAKAVPVQVEASSGAAKGLVGVQVQPSKERHVWEVRLKEVPLPAKTNTVRLRVSNAEGESRQPGVIENVVYVPPLPPPPQVMILEPGSGPIMMAEPKLAVHFRVKSEAPLKRVVLTKGKQELFNPAPETLAKMKPGAQGFVEFRTEPLSLDWGLNDVRVEALAEGGLGQDAVTLNLVSRPVELDLHLLQTQGAKGQPIQPKDEGGKLVFPAVAQGRVWLHGAVRWTSKDDEQLKRAAVVRTYVNGFQQVLARLEPAVAGERQRKFKADLLLAPGDNRVEVVLPELEQDARNRREFAVVRQGPLTPQDPRPHLHVLVIAPGQKESALLKARLLEALKASAFASDLYRTRAFEQVRVHVLPAYVSPGDVFTQMRQIERALRQRAENRAPNDVVMIYYLGQQTVSRAEHFYWTSDTRPGAQLRSTALNLQFLVDTYFDRFSGAQVLLLDVTSPGTAPISSQRAQAASGDLWPGSYRFGVLRHTWFDKASVSEQTALLTGLQQTMPTASGLRELVPTLDALFRQRLSQSSLGQFDPHLPGALQIRLDAP